MIDEQAIIKIIINGDSKAFRILVERYQNSVMRLISNIVNDRHICEDIAQEVFFSAYKKLSTFDSARGKFSTWLFTIARNKSLNAIKKKQAQVVDELPDIAENKKGDELEKQEFMNELDKQLHSLPKDQKTVFVMAEFEKLPYEEIAQIEGVREGTVRTRLHRAKRKLAKALGLDWEI
jgi:RNA polymerase sigma-70 factor (ECF subfamily)